MRKSFGLNNYFFQFVLLVLLNSAFNAITALAGSYFYLMPNTGEPYGAPLAFIAYNTLLKSFLAVVIIHFYRSASFSAKLPFVQRLGLLAVVLYFGNGLTGMALNTVFGFGETWLRLLLGPPEAFIFRINSIVTALLVYYWSMREEKRELEILNQKLELVTLRELKARAELEALQAKINPHFLYNALNSIHTLVVQQPSKAREMIMLLSKLFRLSIGHGNPFYCTIGEELELVNTYLAIEKIRFGEKLMYEIHCAEALTNALIPKFLLQPLVENAVKHGIAKMEQQGSLAVVIRGDNEFLYMQVHDNGPPFKAQIQKGYGLKSVHDKVKILGGEGAAIEIASNEHEIPVSSRFGAGKYVELKLRKREGTNS